METKKKGRRDIFEAAASLGLRGVKYFVESKGVPVTSTNIDNRTAAHMAARTGKLEAIKYLLSKNSTLLNATDKFGYTMYHLAVINGALKVVKFLIKDQKVDVYQPNKIYNGNTAVHFAAESGQLKILRYLVEKKECDINVLNNRGQPPVFLAAARGKTRIIKYIAEILTDFAGITTSDYCNKNILFMSVMIGDTSIPRLLLAKYKLKIDINQRDNTGATLVFWASKLGYLNFLKYIIRWEHADVNIGNNEGRTPLHEAVGEAYLLLTKYLIKQGANKTALDKNGMSPRDYTYKEDILACFEEIGKKRARRNVFYKLAQSSQTQSVQPYVINCLRHFSALPRDEGLVTLICGLVVYFMGNQSAVPEMIRHAK